MEPVTLTIIATPTAKVSTVAATRPRARRRLSEANRPLAQNALARGRRIRPPVRSINTGVSRPRQISHNAARAALKRSAQGGSIQPPGGSSASHVHNPSESRRAVAAAPVLGLAIPLGPPLPRAPHPHT